ncbi:MAG: glycosyltransferase, partial [Verrucomicrobiales bacterium]|nr:glycosyltransferase [Verrucomicrobiales bacterium]
MRFLCVSLGLHPDVVGGAWRVAAEQAAGLARRGHPLEIITANPDGRRPAQEIREGITLHRFAAAPGSFYQKWRAQNRAAAALVRERLAAAGADPVLVVQHHAFLEPALATVPAPILHVFHGPWA